MERIGSGRIAYACSYVPVEIILASGLQPARLIPRGRPSEGDRLIHPATCPYIRSMLADLLDGASAGARGMIFANSCDGMRKLHDIWERAGEPPRGFFLDIPKKTDPGSVGYFASELARLASVLEEKFSGSKVTEKSLEEAIRESNRLRASMRGLFTELARPGASLRGSDVFPLLVESEYGRLGEPASLSAEALGKHAGEDGDLRIVLFGNAMNEPEVVRMIEGKNARIVAFDTCFGIRAWDMAVEEGTGDPFGAIAEAYLLKPACPRMEGIAAQAGHLVRLARDTSAHGVVISQVKYCDGMLYSIPLLREALLEAGVPVLVLENDYCWSDLEKARIKAEAFLETME